MGKTYQSIVINASIDRVWRTIRDFHNVAWAPNVVTTCTPVGDKPGDRIGAKRIINDTFHETLMELSDLDFTFGYTITDGPSPVSPNDVKNYIGRVRLFPVTDSNTTFVEWSSSWDSMDNAAQEYCKQIYIALLDELRQTLT